MAQTVPLWARHDCQIRVQRPKTLILGQAPRTWHNPYTEKEKVTEEKDRIQRESLFRYDQLWTGYEDRQGQMDLREEVISSRWPHMRQICKKVCHPSEVQLDHIVAPCKGSKIG